MSVRMGEEDEECELWEERKEGSADRREVLLSKRKEGMVGKVLAAQIVSGPDKYAGMSEFDSCRLSHLFLLVLVSSG